MEYASSNEVDTETTTANDIDRSQSTGLLGQGAHSFEVGSEVFQPPLFMHASDSPAISHQLVQSQCLRYFQITKVHTQGQSICSAQHGSDH